MTDAWLMEADCIHGCAWYVCDQCGEFDPADVARWEAEALASPPPDSLDL